MQCFANRTGPLHLAMFHVIFALEKARPKQEMMDSSVHLQNALPESFAMHQLHRCGTAFSPCVLYVTCPRVLAGLRLLGMA